MDIEKFNPRYEEMNAVSLIECSKMLGVKTKDFINYLLENKYIYKTDEVKKNRCYEKYTTNNGNGLFYLKVFKGGKNIQTKVTPKGIEYFKRELEEKRKEMEGIQWKI